MISIVQVNDRMFEVNDLMFIEFPLLPLNNKYYVLGEDELIK